MTGSKIASDSIKGGKIQDGKIKAKHLAPGVIPDVPEQAYGRVDKQGATVAPAAGSVGIEGVTSGGAGVICYDLAFTPVSGSATLAQGGPADRPGATVEMTVGPQAGCPAPYTDAATETRALSAATPVNQPLDEAADRDLYVEFIR